MNNRKFMSYLSTAIFLIICINLLLITFPISDIGDKNYQNGAVKISSLTQSTEMYMNISSVRFDDTNSGCVFINISGIMEDVEVMRFNMTWEPTIINLTSIKYNNEMWPMVLNEDIDHSQGYVTAHLFNITNAYGIDVEGEIECVRICFETVEGLTTENCCDLVLLEHEITTGDHDDIICSFTGGTVCVDVQNGGVIDNGENGNDNDQDGSEDGSSFLLFIVTMLIVSVLGIVAIVKIIKK